MQPILFHSYRNKKSEIESNFHDRMHTEKLLKRSKKKNYFVIKTFKLVSDFLQSTVTDNNNDISQR